MIRATVTSMKAKRKGYGNGKPIVGVDLTAEYPIEPFDGEGDEAEYGEVELTLSLIEAEKFHVGGRLDISYDSYLNTEDFIDHLDSLATNE